MSKKMTIKEKKEGVEKPDEVSEGLYNSNKIGSQVFRRTIVQAVTFLVIILLVLLAGRMIHLLLLFFAGIMLAVLLDLFASQLTRLRWIPHWVAITIVLIILLSLLGLFFFTAGPVVAMEMKELASQIEKSIEQLTEWLEGSEAGLFLLDQISGLKNITEDGDLWSRMSDIFSATYSAIFGIGTILIVGVFLAYSPGLYKSGFIHLVPPHLRKRSVEVLTEIGTTLRWWLVGQLISMVILAVTTWIMLTLLNVPLAPMLGLITGLLTFIPYLGPLIALIPILLISFLASPLVVLYVFILYMVIQNVEANVLMPIIFYRTVRIPPALGVISQILFGSLIGVLGFILAIPLMAVILQFIKMVYVEDLLGDKNLDGDWDKIK